jgi:hypothetical protein
MPHSFTLASESAWTGFATELAAFFILFLFPLHIIVFIAMFIFIFHALYIQLLKKIRQYIFIKIHIAYFYLRVIQMFSCCVCKKSELS